MFSLAKIFRSEGGKIDVRGFPALSAGYMYLLRVLIGSLGCLPVLRSVRVITFVLVLRHSFQHRSIDVMIAFYRLSQSVVTFKLGRDISTNYYWS